MRLHLKLTANDHAVPYTYQEQLTGALHRWLGKNEFHDDISLYSFSWLKGGKGDRSGLNFPKGAIWFISAHDVGIIKAVLSSINESPGIAWGMRVAEVTIEEAPTFGQEQLFRLASPVFIKRKDDFYYYDSPESNKLLTDTLKQKLQKAGLPTGGVEVKFDTSYTHPKKKKASYKGIDNKASFCPIVVSGSPEQVAFAWDVGIGNSTGIGFGSLI